MSALPAGKYKLAHVPLSFVNLRAAASAASADLGDLYPGVFVDITGVASGDWVECSTADGIRGWCSLQGGAVVFEPVEVDAPAPATLFIDVSSHNGVISWERAYAAGVREAYVRATMGGAGVDARWQANAGEATRSGVTVGYYALFRPDSEGTAQAYHYLRTVKGVIALPLAVDVERVVAPQRVLTKTQYADQLAAFVRVMQAETGELPCIYTSAGEWGALVGRQHDSLFAQCALWTANYTARPTPTLPRCWKTYWLWQWASSGKVDGINGRCDLNRRKP